jgi:hypothetical protein
MKLASADGTSIRATARARGAEDKSAVGVSGAVGRAAVAWQQSHLGADEVSW